jgi:hypothetical protein
VAQTLVSQSQQLVPKSLLQFVNRPALAGSGLDEAAEVSDGLLNLLLEPFGLR